MVSGVRSALIASVLVVVSSSAVGLGLELSLPDGWYDAYGEIPWKEEALRLDSFAFDLRRHPNYLGYVAIYAGKNESADRVKARTARSKDHLVAKRNIEEGRIIMINAGRKDKRWTILQPVDKNTPAPDFGP